MNDRRVVVIGSGPSGATAALTLLQAGIPVIMLESGQKFPGGLLVRAMGRNVYRRRPPLYEEKGHVATDDQDAVWYRALVPGGLSNYWTGAVPRFAPEDFTDGERLHERYRWPLVYEDLVPYYERIEQLMGVTGSPTDFPNLPACCVAHARHLPGPWQDIAAYARSFGHGLTTLPMADVKPWMVTRSGAAFNSFTQLIPRLQRFPRFELRLGAHALRLEWSGEMQRVRSVHYVERETGTEHRIEASGVVVAGGPLSSTKLLLDSACADFPDGLGNTEGLLGCYLHDHPKDWCVVEVDRPLPRLGQAAYLTRAAYAESPSLLAAASMIGNSGESAREKLLTFTPVRSTTFGVATFGTMIPTPSNYIAQHPQLHDEFGLPALDLHIRYGPEVLATMTKSRERVIAILESAGYKASFQSPLPPLTPGVSVHYGGSIRMHSSPRHGMLNAWNRLHEIDNVVVADASAFTTAVEKNPVLTSMALSARAADRLVEDLRASLVSHQSKQHIARRSQGQAGH